MKTTSTKKKAATLPAVQVHDPHTKEAITDMMVHHSRHEDARSLDAQHQLEQGKAMHDTLDQTLEQHTRTHDAIKENGQSIDDMHEGVTDKLDEVKDAIGQMGDKIVESMKSEEGDEAAPTTATSKTFIILPMPGKKGDTGATPSKQEINAAIEELLPEAVRKVQPQLEELLQMVKDSIAEEAGEDDTETVSDEHIIDLIKRTVPSLIQKDEDFVKHVQKKIGKVPSIEEILKALKGKLEYDDIKGKPNLDTFRNKLGGTGYLREISDVDTTGLVTGQMLTWNGKKWVPTTPSSGGGGGGYTYSEIPSGAIDGANVTFTLAHIPTQPNMILLNWNGAIQSQLGGDFSVSGSTITMATAPVAPSTLSVMYS